MITFEMLFTEIAALKEEIELYNRGLLPYKYINARLNNLSIIIETLLEY